MVLSSFRSPTASTQTASRWSSSSEVRSSRSVPFFSRFRFDQGSGPSNNRPAVETTAASGYKKLWRSSKSSLDTLLVPNRTRIPSAKVRGPSAEPLEFALPVAENLLRCDSKRKPVPMITRTSSEIGRPSSSIGAARSLSEFSAPYGLFDEEKDARLLPDDTRSHHQRISDPFADNKRRSRSTTDTSSSLISVDEIRAHARRQASINDIDLSYLNPPKLSDSTSLLFPDEDKVNKRLSGHFDGARNSLQLYSTGSDAPHEISDELSYRIMGEHFSARQYSRAQAMRKYNEIAKALKLSPINQNEVGTALAGK